MLDVLLLLWLVFFGTKFLISTTLIGTWEQVIYACFLVFTITKIMQTCTFPCQFFFKQAILLMISWPVVGQAEIYLRNTIECWLVCIVSCRLALTVRANDGENQPSLTTVYITIKTVNKWKPAFEQDVYKASVSESSLPG